MEFSVFVQGLSFKIEAKDLRAAANIARKRFRGSGFLVIPGGDIGRGSQDHLGGATEKYGIKLSEDFTMEVRGRLEAGT